MGQLTAVTDALGQVTAYTYDEMGKRVTQTDADGRTTRSQYDALGRPTKRILPLGQAQTFVYDLLGKVSSKTDFGGKTTTYRYDSLNRLIGKTPDPSLDEPPVTFTYSATGRRASMADASGLTTYAYDARDRLIAKTTPRGVLSYSYDATGNVLSIRSSNVEGAEVDYAYDALNRLAGVTDGHLPAGNNVTAYDYDANGNLSRRTYPNGVISTHTHDSLDRATRISITSAGTTLTDYAHAFDRVGNRVSVAEPTAYGRLCLGLARPADHGGDLGRSGRQQWSDRVYLRCGGQPTGTNLERAGRAFLTVHLRRQ